jgi:hypothetical protein
MPQKVWKQPPSYFLFIIAYSNQLTTIEKIRIVSIEKIDLWAGHSAAGELGSTLLPERRLEETD